jgi:hypothetical protein
VRYADMSTGENPVPFQAEPETTTVPEGSVGEIALTWTGGAQTAVMSVLAHTTLHPSETRATAVTVPTKAG